MQNNIRTATFFDEVEQVHMGEGRPEMSLVAEYRKNDHNLITKNQLKIDVAIFQ